MMNKTLVYLSGRTSAKALLYLIENGMSDPHQTKIAKNTKTTFPSISKSIKKLEEMQLIHIKRIGTKINVYLTERGRKIAENILSINKLN